LKNCAIPEKSEATKSRTRRFSKTDGKESGNFWGIYKMETIDNQQTKQKRWFAKKTGNFQNSPEV
jgi:hypothetical protein